MRRFFVGAAAVMLLMLFVYGLSLFLATPSHLSVSNNSSSSLSQQQPTSGQNGNVITVMIPKTAGVFGGSNFTPANITVVIGINNTIKWVNEDSLSSHSITSLSIPNGFPKFDPVFIDYGHSYTMKLTVPGTYVYYCLWHPGWLRGTIVVKSR